MSSEGKRTKYRRYQLLGSEAMLVADKGQRQVLYPHLKIAAETRTDATWKCHLVRWLVRQDSILQNKCCIRCKKE